MSYSVPDWSPAPPKWEPNFYSLLMEQKPPTPPDINYEDFIAKSNKFSLPFSSQNVRAASLKPHTTTPILERNINSTYPIIHESILELCAKFLDQKRQKGTKQEREIYSSLNLLGFIDRLLKKRAAIFVGAHDHYILRNGAEGYGSWETIGTSQEKAPLILSEYLSYDEIKLSAFLSVSGYTYFLNNGSRKNMAKFCEDRSGLEEEGVIVGVIGCRLKRPQCMEFQDMVITKKQNKKKYGYGDKKAKNVLSLFGELYEEPFKLTFDDVTKEVKQLNSRYVDLQNGLIFDNDYFYKRMSFTIDTLLVEASERAKEKKTTAFVHLVGLGLGVWKVSGHQEQVYMDIVAKRILALDGLINHISDICLSYIPQPHCGGYKDGELFKLEQHPEKGIRIHITKREPHEKLTGPNQGKLSVVSFAWDGNSLPGNEWWGGSLGASGDSAAASSTQITELHNAHINPKVQASNLRIVTKSNGVLKFREYQKLVKASKENH